MLFFTFKRVKTASQHGSALFKDKDDWAACVVHALAVATVMQATPCPRPLGHLPESQLPVTPADDELIYLLERLEHIAEETAGASTHQSDTPTRTKTKPAIGLHAYVNRLLRQAARLYSSDGAVVTAGMSSHSFRRGTAQSANADSRLAIQWIINRGGWGMTAMSKGFEYILNTTQEDQKWQQ